MTVQREKAAAHGVAGRVVAADDQQAQRAHELARRHVPWPWPWASIDSRSNRRRAGLLGPQAAHVLGHARQLGEPLGPERTGASGACTLATATSDHQVSWRRSSNGKSNSVASIIVVSSIDTRSTQSNVSPRVRPARARSARGWWARGGRGWPRPRSVPPPGAGVPRRVHADEARRSMALRLSSTWMAAELYRRGVDFRGSPRRS